MNPGTGVIYIYLICKKIIWNEECKNFYNLTQCFIIIQKYNTYLFLNIIYELVCNFIKIKMYLYLDIYLIHF